MNMLKKIGFILNRGQKIKLLLLFIIYLIGSLFELMGVAFILPFVSVISDTSLIYENEIYSKVYELLGCNNETEFVLAFAVALILVYVIKNVYIVFSGAITSRFIANNQRRMTMKMMTYYMYQPYMFHITRNISEILRSMDTDVSMLFTTITSIISLFNEVIISLLIVGYLFILDKSITIGVIVVLGSFSFGFMKLFKKRIEGFGKRYHKLTAEVNIWKRQSFEGIKEIKIANSEKNYIGYVDRRTTELTANTIINSIINSIPKPLFEMVCVTLMMLMIIIKISRGVYLAYFIPVLSAFAISAFRLLPSFGRVTTFYNAIIYNKAGVDGVYGDLKIIKDMTEYNDDEEHEPVLFDKNIAVDGLTFSYPNTNGPVLKNITMSIKKNSSVALIGPSGAGKTTLVDIILGLLQPDEGCINVDGVNVFDNLHSWHKLLGYIPQNIYLIDDTIRNNIIFGIPEAEVDEDKVWQAIRDAQLYDFVNSLPNGIDTVVGERGVRVSGGQRQRIGIARALYNNPQILILDEATSALDTDTETAVMEAIDKLKGNKTMIIIAHRLTTVRNCDYIYEIRDKSVFEKSKSELF